MFRLFYEPPPDLEREIYSFYGKIRKGPVAYYVRRVWRWTEQRYINVMNELRQYAKNLE
jgi:hypothetical protein